MISKVLVVNDPSKDQTILDSLCSLFWVVIVSNAQEAIDQIQTSQNIALLIMDMEMKQSDPFRFLEEIGSIKKAEKIHRIILADLGENYDEIVRNIELSTPTVVSFLKKPVNYYDLSGRIGLHLRLIFLQRMLDERTEESSQILDTILQQIPIGIALAYGDKPSDDIENDIAVINPMYEKITGRKRKELLELGWAKITHPEDRDKDIKCVNDLLSGKIKGYSMEKRYIRPDGEVVWVDIIVAQLELKNDIKYKHICLVQDITGRKKAEALLCESERSRSVLHLNLPGMAYRCNYQPNRTMELVSVGCYELTGYKPESFIDNKDLSFNDIIKEEEKEGLWLEWERVIARHATFRGEYQITTAFGDSKWVFETGRGVYGLDGSAEAIEGIIIDITDRKTNELKLKYLSEHDPVTGLYNRIYLNDVLQTSLLDKEKTNKAVLVLNIKKINSISLAYGYRFQRADNKRVSGEIAVDYKGQH